MASPAVMSSADLAGLLASGDIVLPRNRVSQLRTPATCTYCTAIMPADTWYGWAPTTGGKFHARRSECANHHSAANGPQIVPVPAAPATPAPAANDGVAAIAALLAPHLHGALAGKVSADDVRAILNDEVAEIEQTILSQVRAEMARLQRVDVLEIRTVTAPPITFALYHPSLKEAAYWSGKGKHVYLFGPRGSGKSEMASQLAEAQGLKFYTLQLNQQTSESKIAGLRDAMGVIHTTPFIEPYRNGGLFYLSEADNASGNFLTGLNTALANGYYTTAWGETITMHESFRFVADGNTIGQGHDTTYSSRGRLDGATLDRWVFVNVPYDADLERKLALRKNPNATPWVKWIQEVRRYCDTNKLSVAATPRAAITGAEALADGVLTIDRIADATVFKGLQVVDAATKAKVLANVPYPSADMTYTATEAINA